MSHDEPARLSSQQPLVQWLPDPQSASMSHLLPAAFEKHAPPVQCLPEPQSASMSHLPEPLPVHPTLGHGSLDLVHELGSCAAFDCASAHRW